MRRLFRVCILVVVRNEQQRKSNVPDAKVEDIKTLRLRDRPWVLKQRLLDICPHRQGRRCETTCRQREDRKQQKTDSDTAYLATPSTALAQAYPAHLHQISRNSDFYPSSRSQDPPCALGSQIPCCRQHTQGVATPLNNVGAVCAPEFRQSGRIPGLFFLSILRRAPAHRPSNTQRLIQLNFVFPAFSGSIDWCTIPYQTCS